MSFLSVWRKSSHKITKSKSWKLKSGKGKHIHCNDNVKELLCNKVSLQTFEVSIKGKRNITTSNQRKYLPRFGVTFSSCFFSVVVCNLHWNLPCNLCLWTTLGLWWRLQSYSPSQIDRLFHQPLVSVPSFELLNFLPSGSTYVKCTRFPDSRDTIFHPASSSSPVFGRILEALPEPRSLWRLLDQSFWSPLAINKCNSFFDK